MSDDANSLRAMRSDTMAAREIEREHVRFGVLAWATETLVVRR
jgi:hypothetical protein